MATTHHPRNSALQSAEIAETLLKLVRNEPYVSSEGREEINHAIRTKWHIDCLHSVDTEAWRLHRSVWLYGAADLLDTLVKYYSGVSSEPAAIAIIRHCIVKPEPLPDTYNDGEARP